MGVMLLSAFIVCSLDGSLLLRHLLRLALQLVSQDLYLVLQREYMLVFAFKCHLQGHDPVVNMVTL